VEFVRILRRIERIAYRRSANLRRAASRQR
jgi:hypothetical protein